MGLSATLRRGPLRIASAVALFLCALCALADVAVPPLTGRVVDLTGTLDGSQKATLEEKLAAFETRKGTQIAVLLVPTTEPETIEQFSLRVAEQWKIGRKRVDDGAILVVAKNDRALRIEVGRGLEGALTDVTSHRIISEIITPAFRQGDFYGGIRAGVERMISVADGEALPAPPTRSSWQDRAGSGGFTQMIPIAFMLALVVGGLLRRMLGRFIGAVATGGVVGALAWFVIGALSIAVVAGIIGFVFTLLGGGMIGRPGGWQSGRGGFGGGFPGGWGGGGFGGGGGGGGGGFSGGGGSFGGGGASGRW